MKLIRKLLADRRGAALVEYGLLVAGIALVTTAGTSILGHKTSDLVSSMAAVLPGAHADDNAPIVSGKLIETVDTNPGTDSTGAASTGIGVDAVTIVGNRGTARLGNNLGVVNLGDLVLEP